MIEMISGACHGVLVSII